MVDGQHKLSRRAVLGAVCASSLVRHPGLDPGSKNAVAAHPDTALFLGSGFRRNDGWDRALARFHTALAAVDAAGGEPDQERYDALVDSADESMGALLRSPAPDLAAIAAKLDIIVPHLAWELTGSEDCLEILRRDARRLAAATA